MDKKFFKKDKHMKNIKIRLITFMMSALCLFSSVFFVVPEASFISKADAVSSTVRDLVKVGAYAYGSSFGGNVGGILAQGVVGVALDWFAGSSSSGSDGNKYNYYINNGTTNNYDMTNNYQVFYDYSSNPIINNNQSYNYSFYNPITTTYNYINSLYYNNDYSTYYYNVDNSVDYYVTDNTTHISYYIVDNGTGEEWYYEIYYKLPDGRNSYYLTKDDIWGTYFVYNYDTYENVAEDDGKTLGLWHMDGNLKDDSYWNNSTGSSYTASYVDGVYDGGKKLGTSTSDYITLNLDKVSLPSTYTLEWLEYVPNNNDSSTPYKNSVFDRFETVVEATPQYNIKGIEREYHSESVQTTVQSYSGVCGIGNDYWSIPKGSFIPMALVCNGGTYTLYCNGNKISSTSGWKGGGISFASNSITFKVENITAYDTGWSAYSGYVRDSSRDNSTAMYTYWFMVRTRNRTLTNVFCNYNCIIDEVRLSKGALYTSNYIPSTQAFVTNTVLVPPENGTQNELAFKTNYEISNVRVGGVKPTYPTNGYVYIYLEGDTVKSVQQYQSTGWYEVDASIYRNGEWSALKETDISFLKVSSPDDVAENQKVTVTFKDGTSVFSVRKYNIGDEVSAIKCTNKHYNKEFKGWDTDVSADSVVSAPGASFSVMGDMVLYAVWEDTASDVELKYMDGSVLYKKESYQKGTQVIISDCGNSHHNETFQGWDVLQSGDQVVYSAGKRITLNSDTSLYAVWESNGEITPSAGITVTYMDGDFIYKEEVLEVSGSVEISDCINTHQDSVFQGWDTDSTADEVVYHSGDSIMVSEDAVFYAVWENAPADVTVTYMDGGLVYLEESYAPGENITLSGCSNTRYNSSFKGWDIDSASTDVMYNSGSSFQITEDIVLYAVWADSTSSDNSGGTDNKPDDEGDDSGFWDGILSSIKKIGEFFTGLFGIILDGITSLLSRVKDMLASLTDSVSAFSSFLSGMFGFVPSEFWLAVTTGITLIIVIAVIKFFRG